MDDGTCYCGDAAANFFGFAGTRKCVIYVRDIEEYYRSWDRLLDAGAAIIYPSHGDAFPAAALRKEQGRHKRVFP
jgi:glyoxylase-like metal-dependent hydrolase (beta-lactamase superfamily II)